MTMPTMLTRFLPLALVLLAAGVAPRPAAAQDEPAAALEAFVALVARHWAAEDADAIAALAASEGRVVLDLAGEGPGEVRGRHAAAALRRLFGRREHVEVRVRPVRISGGTPLRGFGELTWSARPEGVTDTMVSTVYVGAVWEDGAWRLRELRVLR